MKKDGFSANRTLPKGFGPASKPQQKSFAFMLKKL